MNAKPVIGLVGAIGAGKSTAAAAFARRGGHVVDADKLGHDALEQPEIRRRVLDRWGGKGITRSTDGRIDRKAVAAIVFANPAERAALEGMVYPYIGMRTAEEVAAAQANPDAKFVVVDAAVMLEAGWTLCNRLAFVDASRPVRLARLAARSGWTAADLDARESAQWSAEEKKKRCDAVIVNEGSREELQEKVDRLLEEWGIV
ncbi:MAG: dephospho-CoA kinase [Gemmataceae bacterium]